MEYLLYLNVKYTEIAINTVVADAAAELNREWCWVQSLYNRNHCNRFAMYKKKLVNCNKRLEALYVKVLQLHEEFGSFYEKTVWILGMKYLSRTPLPFIYTLINNDYNKLIDNIHYLKIAVSMFSYTPTFAELAAYKKYMCANFDLLGILATQRYSKYFHLYAMEYYYLFVDSI